MMQFTFYYFDKQCCGFRKVLFEGSFTSCVNLFVDSYGNILEPTEMIRIKMGLSDSTDVSIIEYDYCDLVGNTEFALHTYNHFIKQSLVKN